MAAVRVRLAGQKLFTCGPWIGRNQRYDDKGKNRDDGERSAGHRWPKPFSSRMSLANPRGVTRVLIAEYAEPKGRHCRQVKQPTQQLRINEYSEPEIHRQIADGNRQWNPSRNR